MTSPEDLVRGWRLRALDNAIASLLLEVGCARLSVDDIARRMGVAKGSLRLGRTEVTAAIERVLERWAERLPKPPPEDGGESPVVAACRTLFAPTVIDGRKRPAFPCCLKQSPCPHGWQSYWLRIAADHGLGTSDLALLVGEAVQAVASTPEIRGLLAEGNVEAALEVLLKLIDSPE